MIANIRSVEIKCVMYRGYFDCRRYEIYDCERKSSENLIQMRRGICFAHFIYASFIPCLKLDKDLRLRKPSFGLRVHNSKHILSHEDLHSSIQRVKSVLRKYLNETHMLF